MSAPATAIADEKAQRELVKDLAEAVSTQAQVANRAWLALITVSLFALIPHALTRDGNIALPFNLGDVPPFWFNGLVFAFLAVLAVAFASAHSQQVRAQKKAHSVIDSLTVGTSSNNVMHLRDYFDMHRKPSLNRVASLAQALRGRYQFFDTNGTLPGWLRFLTLIYYILLKALSFSVYFGLPVVALWQAHRHFSPPGLLHICNIIGTLVAGASLGQVLSLDAIYAVRILKYLWKPTQ